MTHSIIPADQLAKLRESLWVLQQNNLLHHGESHNTVSEATEALSILDSLQEVERLKTVPMKYRRMQFNAELQDENIQLRARLAEIEKPQVEPKLTGCACRWDEHDNRVATCVRHQGWLDVVQEWADRAKYANEVIEQRNAELSRGHADFVQAITDPENQPSQWGTVTLDWHEAELAKAQQPPQQEPNWRRCVNEARMVYRDYLDVQEALNYLEQVFIAAHPAPALAEKVEPVETQATGTPYVQNERNNLVRYAAHPAPAPVNAKLLEKAKAVVARWDTPLWKDVPATAIYIGELREAIAQAEKGQV